MYYFPKFKVGIGLCGLPWWLSGKESACLAGDASLIPESGRSLRERNGNPLQYSCLGNAMERGAWWTIVHGVTESDTTEHARTCTRCIHTQYVGSGIQHLCEAAWLRL